ncbi:DNA mismatch repair protein [Ascosphaera aggregata]|nr:DNA mismatch repair protein [Ascosphaera aggregata]
MVTSKVIRRLPPDAINRITSSLAITNLSDVVLELVKNSLDAGCETLNIVVDFAKGGCSVEDDGCGIEQSEFQIGGGIAAKYHTSKYPNDGRVYYGRKGEFLSCLTALALVIITSRHRSSTHSSTLIFHQSRPVNRLIPAPPQHEIHDRQNGTKVTVTDLFGNFPVRVKQRAIYLQKQDSIDREWDHLKHKLTALLIAFQKPVRVYLSDASKSRKLSIRGKPSAFQRDRILPSLPGAHIRDDHLRSILVQAGFVSASSSDTWVTVSAQTAGISVAALVSLEASPTKQVQFISFGIRPSFAPPGPNSNILYDTINRLFAASTFGGTQIEGVPDGLKKKAPAHKGVNRWPMFCCRIEMQDSDDVSIDNAIDPGSVHSSQSLHTLVDMFSALFRQFLRHYHFLPEQSQNDRNQLSSTPLLSDNRAGNSRLLQDRMERLRTSPSFSSPRTLNNVRTCSTKLGKGSSLVTDFKAARDFASWSRVKASKPSEVQRLVSGLPRAKRCSSGLSLDSEDGIRKRRLSSNISSLEPIERSTRLPAATQGQESLAFPRDTAGYGEMESLPDEAVYYIDQKTRDRLLVNGRTGQSLLKRPTTAPTSRVSSRHRHVGEGSAARSTEWIDGILERWHNPVFHRLEKPPQLITSLIDPHECGRSPYFGRTRNCEPNKGPNIGFQCTLGTMDGRLTKKTLRDAEFIAQVDYKFLLVKMPVPDIAGSESQHLLVLIDQHAADERCRIEQLFANITFLRHQLSEFCETTIDSQMAITTLPEPITFEVAQSEANLFKQYADYFASWGCFFEVRASARHAQSAAIVVSRLPSVISERCRVEAQAAINMLRGEVWSRNDQGRSYGPRHTTTAGSEHPSAIGSSRSSCHWTEVISDCPRGIIEMLNSRACRSAIMFNDTLSRADCLSLISRLSKCSYPFQCAHGRPSMVPLVSLGSSDSCRLWLNGDHGDREISGCDNLRHGERRYQDFSDAQPSSLEFIQTFEHGRL